MKLKICGPKCSLCCTILSVWGIIQLSLMGLFLWVRSPAFIEDLKISEEAHKDAGEFLHAMDESFAQIKFVKIHKKLVETYFVCIFAFLFIAFIQVDIEMGAQNCWIAAVMYAVTLVVSGWQMWVNNSSA